MKKCPTWYNWSLGVGFLVSVTVLGLSAIKSDQKLSDMGIAFGGIGAGVTGIVGARAANKWAESKSNGEESGK